MQQDKLASNNIVPFDTIEKQWKKKEKEMEVITAARDLLTKQIQDWETKKRLFSQEFLDDDYLDGNSKKSAFLPVVSKDLPGAESSDEEIMNREPLTKEAEIVLKLMEEVRSVKAMVIRVAFGDVRNSRHDYVITSSNEEIILEKPTKKGSKQKAVVTLNTSSIMFGGVIAYRFDSSMFTDKHEGLTGFLHIPKSALKSGRFEKLVFTRLADILNKTKK